MAIFLTGSTGYIGAHILSELLGQQQRSRQRAGARERSARGRTSVCGTRCNCIWIFRNSANTSATRITVFRGDLTDAQFGLDASDYARVVATHGFDDSLRGVAESQVRKKLHECEFARHSGNDSTGAAHARSQAACADSVSSARWPWRASAKMKWSRKTLPSTGTVPTTIPTRAQKNSASTWCASCCPTCRKLFSVRASCWAIRATAQQRSSTWSAHSFSWPACRASPAPRRPHRNCARGLRGKSHRHSAPKRKTAARHLSSFFRHRFRNLPPDYGCAGKSAAGKSKPIYAPSLARTFTATVNWLANRKGKSGTQRRPSESFLPYIYWNTVFDNSRVVAEMGGVPAPFSKYCFPLLKFSRENHFQYPYKAWPATEPSPKPQAQGAAR